MWSLEAKRKQETLEDAKLNALKMVISDFHNFWFLTPQKPKFRFFKNRSLQNHFFWDISKNRNI